MNRKIDDLGRISVPKEMRVKIGLENGDEVNVELVGDKIIISNPTKFNLEGYLLQQMEVFKDDCSAYNAYRDIYNKMFG